MATYDVPGHRVENADQLHVGCWAEMEGALLLINDLRGDEVTFNVFADGAMQRQTMKVEEFKRHYSQAGWLWHDKTPQPRIGASERVH
jgi:hypothetical protein